MSEKEFEEFDKLEEEEKKAKAVSKKGQSTSLEKKSETELIKTNIDQKSFLQKRKLKKIHEQAEIKAWTKKYDALLDLAEEHILAQKQVKTQEIELQLERDIYILQRELLDIYQTSKLEIQQKEFDTLKELSNQITTQYREITKMDIPESMKKDLFKIVRNKWVDLKDRITAETGEVITKLKKSDKK